MKLKELFRIQVSVFVSIFSIKNSEAVVDNDCVVLRLLSTICILLKKGLEKITKYKLCPSKKK